MCQPPKKKKKKKNKKNMYLAEFLGNYPYNNHIIFFYFCEMTVIGDIKT